VILVTPLVCFTTRYAHDRADSFTVAKLFIVEFRPVFWGNSQRIFRMFAVGENMDLRVLLTTFGIIFLAEMGDKTQLAAMTMSAQTKNPWAVFIGASIALVAVSAIGVLVGSVIGQYVPLEWVKRIAAALFIVIGVLMLMGKF
jgi:putative Ca2+/H+ antiporter (TMEM165/GDT1 family)